MKVAKITEIRLILLFLLILTSILLISCMGLEDWDEECPITNIESTDSPDTPRLYFCDGIVFTVSIPNGCENGGCGLIFDVHGWSMSAEGQNDGTNMREVAWNAVDRGAITPYIVIQPNANGFPPSWEDGDEEIIYSFLQQAVIAWDIDQDRIHFGGFSAGGIRTHHFICRYYDVIASFAPIGTPFRNDCSPESWRPAVPVFETIGKFDQNIFTVRDTRDLYVSLMGDYTETLVDSGPKFTHNSYTGNGYEYEYLEHDFTGGALMNGHCLPGGTGLFSCTFGSDIKIGEKIIDFYIANPKSIQDQYTQTRYPIALIHGGLGFDRTDMLGLIPLDYWYGIPSELMRSGGTVYVLQMSTLHSPEIRGEQAIRELDTIKVLTGQKKFNLIGHSFGAPTARYMAAVRPDLIASVTTVGGTNDSDQRDIDNPPETMECGWSCDFLDIGGELAALITGVSFTQEKCTTDIYSRDPRIREAALISCEAVKKEYENSGFPISVVSDVEFLETREAFNRKYHWGRPSSWCEDGPMKADNGIYYFSWTGTKLFTNPLDPSDYLLAPLGLEATISGEGSDGLQERCGSHWGITIRDDYPMNHLDEVNLLWGLRDPLFNPISVFRQQANRLKNLGL